MTIIDGLIIETNIGIIEFNVYKKDNDSPWQAKMVHPNKDVRLDFDAEWNLDQVTAGVKKFWEFYPPV